jgi:hypothetical protein
MVGYIVKLKKLTQTDQGLADKKKKYEVSKTDKEVNPSDIKVE